MCCGYEPRCSPARSEIVRGTWQTTGSTVPAPAIGVAVLVAAAVAAWVIPRLAWILGTVAVVVVLAAVLALVVLPRVARWSDRKDREAYAAALPAQARTELPARAPATAAALPPPQPAAIENHVHYHVHLGAGERAPARVITGEVLPP